MFQDGDFDGESSDGLEDLPLNSQILRIKSLEDTFDLCFLEDFWKIAARDLSKNGPTALTSLRNQRRKKIANLSSIDSEDEDGTNANGNPIKVKEEIDYEEESMEKNQEFHYDLLDKVESSNSKKQNLLKERLIQNEGGRRTLKVLIGLWKQERETLERIFFDDLPNFSDLHLSKQFKSSNSTSGTTNPNEKQASTEVEKVLDLIFSLFFFDFDSISIAENEIRQKDLLKKKKERRDVEIVKKEKEVTNTGGGKSWEKVDVELQDLEDLGMEVNGANGDWNQLKDYDLMKDDYGKSKEEEIRSRFQIGADLLFEVSWKEFSLFMPCFLLTSFSLIKTKFRFFVLELVFSRFWIQMLWVEGSRLGWIRSIN